MLADGRFFTEDGRARFVPTPMPQALPRPAGWPLVLNTGRIRDQWHTMTRTGVVARLSSHLAEPFAEIHPADAAAAGVGPADLVAVESPHGRIVVRALVTARQRQGSIFVPMHWTDRLASFARVGALVAARTDPVSGQPAAKSSPAALRLWPAQWYGFAVALAEPDLIDAGYWVKARAGAGWRIELADAVTVEAGERLCQQLLGKGGELLAYHDAGAGQHRFARFEAGRLVAALFTAREPVAVARSWLADQLGLERATVAERLRLLSGRPGDGAADPGPLLCACRDVGLQTVIGAIRAVPAPSVHSASAAPPAPASPAAPAAPRSRG
jgi:assimilatory nitrate reductase catalytic subunit